MVQGMGRIWRSSESLTRLSWTLAMSYLDFRNHLTSMAVEIPIPCSSLGLSWWGCCQEGVEVSVPHPQYVEMEIPIAQ